MVLVALTRVDAEDIRPDVVVDVLQFDLTQRFGHAQCRTLWTLWLSRIHSASSLSSSIPSKSMKEKSPIWLLSSRRYSEAVRPPSTELLSVDAQLDESLELDEDLAEKRAIAEKLSKEKQQAWNTERTKK